MGGGVRALAAARSLRPALRLRLGRRHLPAGTHGTAGRLHAGADRRHAGGKEGAAWLPSRRPGKRAELARTAGRLEGSWPDDRAGTGHRRRCARLLEGARGGIADDPAPALHRAQDRQRARQVAQVRAARSQNGPAPDLGGAGPRDGRDGDRDICREIWSQIRQGRHLPDQGPRQAVRTKGALSQATARMMVFKLVMTAAKTWRRLKGENQLPKVIQGITFTNGVEVINTPAQSAA